VRITSRRFTGLRRVRSIASAQLQSHINQETRPLDHNPSIQLLRPARPAQHCDDRVCLRVPLREHISKTTCPIFTKFREHVSYGELAKYGHGSVLLWWRRCDTLCTSGFMDDVMSSHHGPVANAR